MAWYDSDESSNVSSDDNQPKPLPSPYQCILHITVSSQQEVKRLKDVYSPFLQWIDPVFRIVEITEERNEEESAPTKISVTKKNESITKPLIPLLPRTKTHSDNKTLRENGFTDLNNSDKVITQAMSVVLFLHDGSESELNANRAKEYLASPPWEFHHKIALASKIDYRTVARQDYYQISAELPLWCVCAVHCGKESLRFNIFVRNFDKMVKFYKSVIGKEISASKEGFCYFNLYSQPGFDIQLSLKYSNSLQPRPLNSTILKFKLDDINDVKPFLVYPLTSFGNERWCTKDPDGNTILLIHDNWEDITWSTRDSLSEYSSASEDDCSCYSDVSTDCHLSYSESDDAWTDSAYNSDPVHSITDW